MSEGSSGAYVANDIARAIPVKIKINPNVCEKSNTRNVTMIEIARNLYPSLCIFGNIVFNII